MKTEAEKTEAECCAHTSPIGGPTPPARVQVASIAALQRLAAHHIESARALYSIDWKYPYANMHMDEAQRIAEQIASFVSHLPLSEKKELEQ